MVKTERFNRDLGIHFFTQNVVGIWNVVPEEAGTKTIFKRQLDKYMIGEV